MRRTGAPAAAAAGLVCAVLVTLLALVDRGSQGQQVALEDPTTPTGEVNADKWRNSIKDLWAKPLGMGVPQPGYKKKSAALPSLVLNMPMQAPSRTLPYRPTLSSDRDDLICTSPARQRLCAKKL